MRRRISHILPLALALAMLVSLGCHSQPKGAVDLLIAVRTDYLAGKEFASIEVRVSGTNDKVVKPACKDGSCISFAQPRLVATFDKLPRAQARRVEVSLLDKDGHAIASDEAVLDHEDRLAMVLWITRNCAAVACADGQRCLGSSCVDERCTDGTQAECTGRDDSCNHDDDCPMPRCGVARCQQNACTVAIDADSCAPGQTCTPEIGCENSGTSLPDEPDASLDAGTPPSGNDDAGTTPGVKNRFPKLQPEATQYLSLTGTTLDMFAWIGNEVAILTTSDQFDPAVIGRILTVYDDVYTAYDTLNGHTPQAGNVLAGRAVIAFVPSTCGNGTCFTAGQAGMEVLEGAFSDLYVGVRDADRFDLRLLETLALTFWFYEPQVGFPNSDVVAFAFSTCSAMEGLQTAHPSVMERAGQPFVDYLGVLTGFVDTYVMLGAPWDTTLGAGGAPANNNSLDGGDLLCSMWQRLRKRHGNGFDRDFWQQVGSLPSSQGTLESASDGLLVAASRAARADLSPVIADRWGFPVTAQGRALARAAGPAVKASDY